jgi:hypothetical protein
MCEPTGWQIYIYENSVIAQFLNLAEPNLYTGHCFQRSSATLLTNSGVGFLGLKRHGGWKNSGIAESYVAESVNNKLETTNKIFYNKRRDQRQYFDNSCEHHRTEEPEEIDKRLAQKDSLLLLMI